MRGEKATIPDIELSELVLPANLVSDESLSPDATAEEEPCPYRIDSHCHSCGSRIRVTLVATEFGIRCFEQLLFRELCLLCPTCSRQLTRNGRS
uniref:Protein E7 n=1 Tax=Human papillomavirus TaxID=10566 RepID=A0A386H6W4_9PAPI|nr:MAG: E7 protein [Human papillomavirus]